MYQRKAAIHIERSKELLACSNDTMQFGVNEEDVKAVNEEDVKIARGFSKWVRKGHGEGLNMRKKFDAYMDMIEAQPVEGSEYTIFANDREHSNLYVSEYDLDMKDLRISLKLNRKIKKEGKFLLVISDKASGYKATTQKLMRRWFIIEYESEKQLEKALKKPKIIDTGRQWGSLEKFKPDKFPKGDKLAAIVESELFRFLRQGHGD